MTNPMTVGDIVQSCQDETSTSPVPAPEEHYDDDDDATANFSKHGATDGDNQITLPRLLHHHRKCAKPDTDEDSPEKSNGAEGSTSSNNSSNGDSNGYDACKSGGSNGSSDGNSGSGQGFGSGSSDDGEENGARQCATDELLKNVSRKNPFLLEETERDPPFSSSDYSSSSEDGLDNNGSATKRPRLSHETCSVTTNTETESDYKPTARNNGKKLRPFPYFYYTDYSHLNKERLSTNKSNQPSTFALTRPGHPASFPVKLHAILTREELTDIITWMPHGRSFKILNIREFELRVLPVYFKSSRVSSFLQEAWEWGFHKMQNGTDKGAFYSEYFLRGIPQICMMMKHSLSARLNENAYDDDHEPNLLRISEEHPLPDLPEDNVYFKEISSINKLIHEIGPSAKMVGMPNDLCCTSSMDRDFEEDTSQEQQHMPQHDNGDSNVARGTHEEPRQGTHQQMQEYFQERLMNALANLQNSSTNSVTHENQSSQTEHSTTQSNEVSSLVLGILSHDRKFSSAFSDANAATSEQESDQIANNSENTLAAFVSNPLYMNALQAWKSLATAQNQINSTVGSPHSQANTDVDQQDTTIVFPSQSSIDLLCALLVQAISLGAQIGFEAIKSSQNRQDDNSGTENADKSDSFSSD